MALTAAKRAMFAVFSSKGNGPKTRIAPNSLLGPPTWRLYDSSSPAVAIPDSVASQDKEVPGFSTQTHILNHDDGYSEH
ncbi:uncharacterized protein FPRN_07352 [Fusarium proliferatum]|nr:uncharacterized protein FPRN_07352 [Fusarium proliferatum]